jgi:hypothetical protein
MTRNRLLYVMVAALGALLVAGTLQPSLLALVGPADPETDSPQMAMEQWRAAKLDGTRTILAQRMKAKQAVLKQLVDREITLFEAGAWFLYLNDNPRNCPDSFRKTYPGANDAEKACRQVIAWTRRSEPELRELGSRADMEVERLERELREHIAGNGRVVLPNLW